MTATLSWNTPPLIADRPVYARNPKPDAVPVFQSIANALDPYLAICDPVVEAVHVDPVKTMVRAFAQALTAGAKRSMAMGLNHSLFDG